MFKMTPLVFLFALALGHVTAGVIELKCSDNATCIEHMLKEAARSLRQQQTVRLFDVLTIEPLKLRQARSNDGPLTRFTKSHAFSFDWNDFEFRLTRPQGRSDVLDLEIYESRSAKDVSDQNPKKSSSKVEEEKETDKGPHRLGHRRRQKKKVLMAVVPLLFGMKSAAVVIFAMAIVTALTIKAFLASKAALIVTVGMAVKKLYESYSSGVGLNHPYLYSQYPIDFPSASSHAYSVSGVSPQFASPELYNPTGLGAQQHAHELLQQPDASAQQSQQAPTLQLVNSTRAAERWDGKSKLLKLLEPVFNSIRSFFDPIANVFYSMPATFRGLNSEVSTASITDPKSFEPEAQESVTQGKIILVPQPRLIAQRKMTHRKPYRQRPKKYTELQISLDRLKHNKDLYDYIKTKKYKYNYPKTFFYPKVKYFVNPNSFMTRPNNSRLRPYRKETFDFTPKNSSFNASNITSFNESSEWKPIVVIAEHPVLSMSMPKKMYNKQINNKTNAKTQTRVKRSLVSNELSFRNVNFNNIHKRSVKKTEKGIMGFIEDFFSSEVMYSIVKQAQTYAKTAIRGSLKSKEPPKYYSIVYEILVWSLDIFDGLLSVEEAVSEHALSKNVDKSKPALKRKANLKKKKS